MPERTVIDIRPLGDGSGDDGYEVDKRPLGRLAAQGTTVQRARGVVVAAGSAGHEQAAAALSPERLAGPDLPRLGELVRTNSESILAVTVPEDYPEDLIKRVAITSSIYPDAHTHIETVTYGDAATRCTASTRCSSATGRACLAR